MLKRWWKLWRMRRVLKIGFQIQRIQEQGSQIPVADLSLQHLINISERSRRSHSPIDVPKTFKKMKSMKQLIMILFFVEILICSNAYSITNNNSSIRIKVFEYLKAKNEYVGYNASYSEYKNSFYIYDLRKKKTIINNRCICFFGVYNEENNQYLLYRSGLIVRFIDPTETPSYRICSSLNE